MAKKKRNDDDIVDGDWKEVGDDDPVEDDVVEEDQRNDDSDDDLDIDSDDDSGDDSGDDEKKKPSGKKSRGRRRSRRKPADEDEDGDQAGEEKSSDQEQQPAEPEEEEDPEPSEPDHPDAVAVLKDLGARLDLNKWESVWRIIFYENHDDAVLEQIHGLPCLKEIWLLGTKVSKEGHESLKERMPELTIYYE